MRTLDIYKKKFRDLDKEDRECVIDAVQQLIVSDHIYRQDIEDALWDSSARVWFNFKYRFVKFDPKQLIKVLEHAQSYAINIQPK